MHRIQHVQPGDPVITTDINRKGAKPERVATVGRKFITLTNGDKYALATGAGASKDYGFRYHVYTMAEWERLQIVETLQSAYMRALPDWKKIREMPQDRFDRLLASANEFFALIVSV